MVLHPAKYSKEVMLVLRDEINDFLAHCLHQSRPIRVLDPFAGTGRIHDLAYPKKLIRTVGIEIEKPWADMHPDTRHGDSTKMPPRWTGLFEMICTSPTYGNRFADHHTPRNEAKTWTRRSYTYDLRAQTGDPLYALDPRNTGLLRFTSPKYKELHLAVYRECWRVLQPGGRFVLNVSDSYSDGRIVPVAAWHRDALVDLGLRVIREHNVPTQRLRKGSNSDLRVPFEKIYVLERAA